MHLKPGFFAQATFSVIVAALPSRSPVFLPNTKGWPLQKANTLSPLWGLSELLYRTAIHKSSLLGQNNGPAHPVSCFQQWSVQCHKETHNEAPLAKALSCRLPQNLTVGGIVLLNLEVPFGYYG